MSTAALATLGCKVNQCESAYLQEQLSEAGFRLRPFVEKSEVYCINTCAVTGKAAMQSRQLIRRAARLNPHARIAVMGCYAQIAAEEIASIPGVTHIFGTTEKLAAVNFLTESPRGPLPCIHVQDRLEAADPFPLVFTGFAHRTRAFLKVQDGCDAFCSYCVVPYCRGRSRSIALEFVVKQLQRFLDNGHQEAVLCGIHLGQWGSDLQPQQNLVGLLEGIQRLCPPPRLRLSSLEPGEITPELLEMMAAMPQLCPHLHVPLQSGDVNILRSMNRHYSPDLYREIVADAICRIPDLAVGTDVLVGFPGETDESFRHTYSLLESLPIAYLHVFPFSARPRTPASTMEAHVSPSVIQQRCRLLRQLDQEKRLTFLQRFIGGVRPVLVENRRDRATGMHCGFSDNYLPVLIQADSNLRNQVVMTRIDQLQGLQLVATPI